MKTFYSHRPVSSHPHETAPRVIAPNSRRRSAARPRRLRPELQAIPLGIDFPVQPALPPGVPRASRVPMLFPGFVEAGGRGSALGGRQRGVAAVEFALIMFVLLLIVAGLAEFGRAFWYYDALTKGTRDAARSLSIVPTAGLGGAVAPTAAMVVDAANASLVPDFTGANVSVVCAPTACAAATLPTQVTQVTVSVDYDLIIGTMLPFIASSASTGNRWPVTLTPHTTMPYMWAGATPPGGATP